MNAMSGHSKWAGIKHKKAIVDARRGAQFTKLARAITVAAREGGGDPDATRRSRTRSRRRKDASMPKDNIERAIAKGTGAGADADAIETVLYEGYGPGGVALLIEAYTENRNRTGADVRHLLSKHGGNLGEPGSVAYLFEKRGVVVVDGDALRRGRPAGASRPGAEDIVADDDLLEVDHRAGRPVGGARRDRAARASRSRAPRSCSARPSRVELDEAARAKLFRLIEALEDNDDVGAVHANFEVSDEILEKVVG